MSTFMTAMLFAYKASVLSKGWLLIVMSCDCHALSVQPGLLIWHTLIDESRSVHAVVFMHAVMFMQCNYMLTYTRRGCDGVLNWGAHGSHPNK